MSTNASLRAVPARPRRVAGQPIQTEGEGGVFTESWFPIALSSEIGRGQVRGYDFLDGRVIVFRDADGTAHVLSAYCPHLGADLSVGDVHENQVRCAFHHWTYDCTGRCTGTKVGDAPPAAAQLYRFHTVEKYGVVWAFNGEQPWWELPSFPHPESELTVRAIELPQTLPVDPWLLCCNTPDMQHIKALHGVTFESGDPHDQIDWTDHSLMYDFAGLHRRGEKISNRIGVFGTSLYYQVTELDGRWFGFMAPFGLPRPGVSRVFMIVAARSDSGTPEDVEKFLDRIIELESSVVGEDIAIMQTIRFRPGTLTAADRTLGRYFQFLRSYPRSHPSADFIK